MIDPRLAIPSLCSADQCWCDKFVDWIERDEGTKVVVDMTNSEFRGWNITLKDQGPAPLPRIRDLYVEYLAEQN